MNESQTPEQETVTSHAGISRRDLLLGAGALGGLAMAGTAFAETMQHDHSKHMAQQPDLLDAVNVCLDKGRRCISHCMVVFKEGDTSLADCCRQSARDVCGLRRLRLSA